MSNTFKHYADVIWWLRVIIANQSFLRDWTRFSFQGFLRVAEESTSSLPVLCGWSQQGTSRWAPLKSMRRMSRGPPSNGWKEQPAERNRQLQRKLYWCPLLRLQCPSWSEMEMIGLICFQRPQSWLVELRNFATRSFMRTWKPCLWGANSTMPKLTPDPSQSAFQCTPTTQVSWSVPSVCENMWDHVRPQCCNGAVWSVFTNASFTKDRESTMPQRVFTLFPFLQCTPISLDKLQSFWTTDTHLDSVSWEQWW